MNRSWLIDSNADITKVVGEVVEVLGSDHAQVVAEWAKNMGLDERTKPFRIHVSHEEGVGLSFHVEW